MGNRRQDVLTGLKAGILDAWRKAAPVAKPKARPGPSWATVSEIAGAWGVERAHASARLRSMEREGKAERKQGHPCDWWGLK